MKFTASLLALVLCPLLALPTLAAPVTIPGFTAYSEPDPNGIDIQENVGVFGWKDPAQQVAWHGDIAATGSLQASVTLKLPAGEHARWRLHVSGQQPAAAQNQTFTLEAEATGTGADQTVPFGEVTIAQPGYYRLALEGVSKSDATFGDVSALVLDGPAAALIEKKAGFNFSRWRSPAAVHLGFQTPPEPVAAFYTEVTPLEDPVNTYYCAAGFGVGYFGIQVNGPAERRVIFSVWDNASEAKDRANVGDTDRVRLVAKGKDVFSGDFGNEGTGGHSHLVYPWKTGATQRFLVTAQADGDAAIFAGYFYFPERKAWGLISAWRRPRAKAELTGLYAFNEVFSGGLGQMQRKAEFGNSWIKTFDGRWMELTSARFSRTGEGEKVRKDYGAGVRGDRFYLVNGGSVPEKTEGGDYLTRFATGHRPTDLTFPALGAK